jgi:hypothetical protein
MAHTNNGINDKWMPWNRPYIVTSNPVYCLVCEIALSEEEMKEHLKECRGK